MAFVTRTHLEGLLRALDAGLERPGSISLVGETSLLWQGSRRWCGDLDLVPELVAADRERFDVLCRELEGRLGATVVDESPADVIPLPDGWRQRAVPIEAGFDRLTLRHFDPYSVAYRFIARGDEPDYRLVIDYLRLGWIDEHDLERRLQELLPRFSFDTIQQDPAEFRRKYAGLCQLWRAERAGVPQGRV